MLRVGLGLAAPQASLDPHASVFPHPLLIAGAAGEDLGPDEAVGLERLKTEDCGGGDARVCFGGDVVVACGAGVEKSKRSPKAELALVA